MEFFEVFKYTSRVNEFKLIFGINNNSDMYTQREARKIDIVYNRICRKKRSGNSVHWNRDAYYAGCQIFI